jgi:hypothetical protein
MEQAMTARREVAFATPADLSSATGHVISLRGAYRVAEQVGAFRVGGRVLLPIDGVRREFGNDLADAVCAAVVRRMNTIPT